MSRRGRLATVVIAGAVSAGLLFALAVLLWPVPEVPATVAGARTPEQVERGRYLATAADCVACHTAEGGTPYAGGRAFVLPFGTIHAPNITPDAATGLGGWKDGEFLRAMRDGIGRHGEELYPAFPYASYAGMTDEDILAIKAFLDTLAPVSNAARRNSLRFPFNQRRLVRFWNVLYLDGDPFEADDEASPEWNRGAYLVTAVGHCGECHTPRSLLYGVTGDELAGETVQGWTAWNITSSRTHGIGAWSDDELVGYLRTGYAPGRAAASGPMKEAIDYSLRHLTDADLRAMATYLRSVEAEDDGPPTEPPNGIAITAVASGPPPLDDRYASGRQVFEGACAGCHAWNGKGLQSPVADLAGRRSVADPAGLNVVQTILHGGAAGAGAVHAFMPGFAAGYSDAEIASTANFTLRVFGGHDGRVSADDVRRLRDDSPGKPPRQ